MPPADIGAAISTPAIYILGAPRSGTTWLQNLIGAHPRAAAPQELDLFGDYVARAEDTFSSYLVDREAMRRQRGRGLPSVLTTERFQELIGSFIDSVYDEVLALKPSAEVVVEKTPRYSLCGPVIRRYVPDAVFVHIIRDARDVVASLLRARKGWGAGWAPSLTEEAAKIWSNHVRSAMRIRELTDRYIEVRYEELTSPAGPQALQRVMTACDLDVTSEECVRIYSESTTTNEIVCGGEVIRRLGEPPGAPEGFVGPAKPGTWLTELDWYQRWVVDRVAGDLLVELGYVDSKDWAPRNLRARLRGPLRLRRERMRWEWDWRWPQIRNAVRRY